MSCTTCHYACDCREKEFAQIRAERDAAVAALSVIEERYVDSCEFPKDWRFMGETACAFFRENEKKKKP
jgi:hypothetical protein